jgi:hypothetical protein
LTFDKKVCGDASPHAGKFHCPRSLSPRDPVMAAIIALLAGIAVPPSSRYRRAPRPPIFPALAYILPFSPLAQLLQWPRLLLAHAINFSPSPIGSATAVERPLLALYNCALPPLSHAFVAHSTLGVDRNVLESPFSSNSRSPEAGFHLPQNILLGGYLTVQTNPEGLL